MSNYNQNYLGFDITVENDFFNEVRIYADQKLGNCIFQQVSLSNNKKDILKSIQFVKRLIRTSCK